MVDYGICWSCVTDLTSSFSRVSGRRVLAESIARRITTPRGRLITDPNYGIDVRDWLLDSVGPGDLSRLCALLNTEISKDARVLNASTSASFVAGVLTLTVAVADGQGPFKTTITVSSIDGQVKVTTP